MAIRRISELDKVDSNSIENPTAIDPFSKFLFETSEFQNDLYTGETEPPSYYLSKFMTWQQLSSLLLADVWAKINQLEGRINELSAGNASGDKAMEIINGWKSNGMTGDNYGPDNIVVNNLTVNEPINGCALSAKWA